MKTLVLDCILVITLFIGLSIAYGQDNKNNRAAIAVFNFKTRNCSPALGIQVPEILRNGLSKSKKYNIVEKTRMDEILKKRNAELLCRDMTCAVKSGKILSVDRSIIGSITRTVKKVGEKKISSLITKDIKKEIFIVRIKIIDVHSGRSEKNFTEFARSKRSINRAVMRITKKINRYYRKSGTKIAKETVHETDSPYGFELRGISLSAAYLKAMGAYSNVADYGYGMTIHITGTLVPYRNIVPMFSLSLFSIENDQENIKSSQLSSMKLNIGYTISLKHYINLNINIIPYFGAGYLFQIINGDKNGIDETGEYEYSRKVYYDPLICVGFEINYTLFGNYVIFLQPAYTLFFEKNNTGQYFSTFLGAKMLL